MTTENLLTGLKELLNSEYRKAGIKLAGKDYETVEPYVYIGFLPQTVNDKDFPSVVIVPPAEAVDDEMTEQLPVTFVLSVMHRDTAQEPGAFMDILTLAERTKAILMSNNTIGAFRRTGKVTWGVDAAAGRSVSLSVGEITATYETVSSYQENLI